MNNDTVLNLITILYTDMIARHEVSWMSAMHTLTQSRP
jgi:hypothetical protein